MKYRSIYEINHLSPEERTRIFRSLVPPAIFSLFEIDRTSFLNRRGEKVVQFHTPETHGFASVDIKMRPEDIDSIFFLQISDTPFMDNMELSFVVINDPRKERYQIDRDPAGERYSFRDRLEKCARRRTRHESGTGSRAGETRSPPPGGIPSASWSDLPQEWGFPLFPGKRFFTTTRFNMKIMASVIWKGKD